jgi:uncharacterized iron-regulated membrane protein
LIVLGIVLWVPRKWSKNIWRASFWFRSALGAKARDWNWHNVLGIWCALPLLVIALTGVVMSFDWANALLFRLSGSTPAVRGNQRRGGSPRAPLGEKAPELDYGRLLAVLKAQNPAWRTIALNIGQTAHGPVAAVVDNGTGGQPQHRIQYLLNRDTAAVLKATYFADGSVGQQLRAFVRFGHTGEYYGIAGQFIAGLVSLAACVLVYTGLSLFIRRLALIVRRKCRQDSSHERATASQIIESAARAVSK